MRFLSLVLLLFISTSTYAEQALQLVDINSLRPTQYSVGMLEVERKAEKLSKMNSAEYKQYLQSNPIPAVLGPSKTPYIIDHHHLSRAILMISRNQAYLQIIADYNQLSEPLFWSEMKRRGYVYLYDNRDQIITTSQLPLRIQDLVDDPYRSLAGEVRRAGGYTKSTVPFAEFSWARFFRTRINIGTSKKDFKLAVEQALRLARSPEAKDLPGYIAGNKL